MPLLKFFPVFWILLGGLGTVCFGDSLRKSAPHQNRKELLKKFRAIKKERLSNNAAEAREGEAAPATQIVELELFSGEVIPFKVDEVKERNIPENLSEKEKQSLSDWEKFEYTSVRGHVVDEMGSSVVLVFADGKVSGSVHRGGKHPVKIQSVDEDAYVAEEVESEPFHCGNEHEKAGDK